jgi:hypothetical protein
LQGLLNSARAKHSSFIQNDVWFEESPHPNHAFVKDEVVIPLLKPNKNEKSEKVFNRPTPQTKHLIRGDKPLT